MEKVKIYSTPTCPYCNMAKEFFKTNSIEFTSIDVSSDKKASNAMVKKTGQMAVPVIIVGEGKKEEVILGFDEERLKARFKIK